MRQYALGGVQGVAQHIAPLHRLEAQNNFLRLLLVRPNNTEDIFVVGSRIEASGRHKQLRGQAQRTDAVEPEAGQPTAVGHRSQYVPAPSKLLEQQWPHGARHRRVFPKLLVLKRDQLARLRRPQQRAQMLQTLRPARCGLYELPQRPRQPQKLLPRHGFEQMPLLG